MPRLQSSIARVREMLCGAPTSQSLEKPLKSPTLHVVTSHEVPPPAYEAIMSPVFEGVDPEKRVSFAYASSDKGAVERAVTMPDETGTSVSVRDATDKQSTLDDEHIPAVHQLPPEILAEVFAMVPQHGLDPGSHLSPSSIILSQVCRHWRALALSIPDLWSTINIDIAVESQTPRALDAIANIIVLHAARAGTRTLDIRLGVPDLITADSLMRLAPVVRSLALRWRVCELPTEMLAYLGNLSAPSLERMCLTGSVPTVVHPENCATLVAPRLTAIEASAPIQCMHLPWSQISELNCVGTNTLADAQYLIEKCPSLRQLTIDAACAHGVDHWSARHRLPTTLKTLVLRCWAMQTPNARMLRTVMSAFILPQGLEELVIEPTEVVSQGSMYALTRRDIATSHRTSSGSSQKPRNVVWPSAAWSALVRRWAWAAGLRSLTLRHVTISSSELREVLDDLPGLKKLAIWEPVAERWPNGRPVEHEKPVDAELMDRLMDMPELQALELEGNLDNYGLALEALTRTTGPAFELTLRRRGPRRDEWAALSEILGDRLCIEVSPYNSWAL
ncbi:hypothetical protein EV121DRAFT_286621 [Schizophyllum commune]